jgi:hypothetical protein
MRAALGILLLLTAAPAAAPQEKPQFVLGRVVDAATGAGVPGARVTLGPVSRPNVLFEFVESPSSAPVSGPRVITSADGRFLFRDVSPGRYSLGVDATGYVPASFGQSRAGGPGLALDITSGGARTDVVIRTWRYASVSGTVVDERGEPAVGVGVRCFVEGLSGGQRRLRSNFAPQDTDDRGEYRIANLEPGTYVCGVQARYGTRPATPAPASAADTRRLQDSGSGGQVVEGLGLRVNDHLLVSPIMARGVLAAPDRNGRLLVYPTRFFPGVPTTTLATRIPLSSGEHRTGINFTMDLVPSTTISGIVQGPDGPVTNLNLTLVPASGSDFVSEGAAIFSDTVTATGGRFTFLGVPPGDYLLKSRLYPRPIAAPGTATQVEALDPASLELGLGAARAPAQAGRPLPPPPPDDPTLWTATPLSVGESAIDNLVVTLNVGVRVTGRVVFEGERTQPTADEVQRMTIRLQSAEGRTSSPTPAEGRAAADGTFRTAGFPAGRYIITALESSLPQGWRLRSATYLGKDVTVEPFEVADREITGVVLTFTDKVTRLSGTVQGIESAGAELIVFPADSVAWRTVGAAARRSRYERIGLDGAFAIGDLPPGDYYVAARPADSTGEWRDPAVLERLTRTATRVTLGDGEQKRVDLKLVRP